MLVLIREKLLTSRWFSWPAHLLLLLSSTYNCVCWKSSFLFFLYLWCFISQCYSLPLYIAYNYKTHFALVITALVSHEILLESGSHLHLTLSTSPMTRSQAGFSRHKTSTIAFSDSDFTVLLSGIGQTFPLIFMLHFSCYSHLIQSDTAFPLSAQIILLDTYLWTVPWWITVSKLSYAH